MENERSLCWCGGVGAALLIMLSFVPAQAHFQELIPTLDIVTGESSRTVALEAKFTHPFAGGPVMDMGMPVRFGVLADGTTLI